MVAYLFAASDTNPVWVAVVLALVASVPGTLAYRASRKHDDGDVFVRRDEASWQRMLDSIARTDKDLTDLRAEHDELIIRFDERGRENAGLRAEVADLRSHTARCDAALDIERGERRRLQDEVRILRARIEERP